MMARTKSSTKNCNQKTKKQTKPKRAKSKSKSKTKPSSLTNIGNDKLSISLNKEHEDDVHEALLCVLQTQKIPKQQLLKMAKYGGIENHVGMIYFCYILFGLLSL